MPPRIFVDTLFVVALVNCRDQYQQQASILADQVAGHPLLVTDAVLLEIGNALARNYKAEAIEIIDNFFTSEARSYSLKALPFTSNIAIKTGA